MSVSVEEAIVEELKLAVAELAEAEVGEVTRESTLAELDIDSLKALGLVVRMERKFRIRLSESEIRRVRTVGDMVDLALSKGATGS